MSQAVADELIAEAQRLLPNRLAGVYELNYWLAAFAALRTELAALKERLKDVETIDQRLCNVNLDLTRENADLRDELAALKAENERLEAACAAMRDELVMFKEWIETKPTQLEHARKCFADWVPYINASLASDAGSALLRRLQLAERVAEEAGKLMDRIPPELSEAFSEWRASREKGGV